MVTPSASPPLSEQRRLARAGRSPVSLQRQTNARLARHRLKIKQQRSDQLASLALMEREKLARESRREQFARARQGERRAGWPTSSYPATAASSSLHTRQNVAGNSNDDYLRIDIEEVFTPDSDQSAADHTSSQGGFLRDLLGRLSGRSNASSLDLPNRNEWIRQQQQSQDSSEAALIGFDVVDSGDQQRRRHQQQVGRFGLSQAPNRNSVALEIRDNQRENNSARQGRLRQSYRSNRTSTSTSTSASTSTRATNSDPNRLQPMTGQQLADNIESSQHRLIPEQTASLSTQMTSSKRHLADFRFSPGSSSLLPDATSLSLSANSSSSLSINKPFCKICHLSSNRNGNDKLISPCKCSGTMQYVHCGCLLKWLEISNRANEKPISCELCSHEYTWHKRFNYNHIKLPRCSAKDAVLHLVFVLALVGMMCCALAPLLHGRGSPLEAQVTASAVMMPDGSTNHRVPMGQAERSTRDSATKESGDHQQGTNNKAKNSNNNGHNSMKPLSGSFSSSRHQHNGMTTFSFPTAALPSSAIPINNSKLASDEKFVLACAALFFVSFFIAIYAQTKTRDTLYGLIIKFTNMNLTYFITEYHHGTNQTCSSSSEPTTNTSNNVATASDRDETNQCGGGDTDDYHYDQMTDYSQTAVVEQSNTSTTSRDNNDASQHTDKNGTNKKCPQR